MNAPIFIIGYERSGTTLLRRIASMHPALNYELVHERRDLLMSAKSVEHAFRTMTYDATQSKQKTGSTMSIRAGQKVPYTSSKHLRATVTKALELFPNASFVHIVRDPVGAINSQIKTFNLNVDKCIDNYFASVPMVVAWLTMKVNPFIIDYDKLIKEPKEQIGRLYEWMGEAVDESYIEKVISNKDPWTHNGRVMCGLRYFDCIKPTRTNIILTEEKIAKINNLKERI